MFELIFQDFIRLFQENPLGQFFGIIATVVALYGFFQVDDIKSKLLILLSVFFWFLHFLFLELFIPMITMGITFSKILISIKYEKNTFFCSIIIIMTLIFGLLTFQSLIHSIPVVTSSIGTLNFFFFHGIVFRLFHIFNSILWIFYSVVFGSIGGMINHTLTIFILIIAIIRLISYRKSGIIHRYKVDTILKKQKKVDTGELIHNRERHILVNDIGYIHFLVGLFKKNK